MQVVQTLLARLKL